MVPDVARAQLVSDELVVAHSNGCSRYRPKLLHPIEPYNDKRKHAHVNNKHVVNRPAKLALFFVRTSTSWLIAASSDDVGISHDHGITSNAAPADSRARNWRKILPKALLRVG